MQKGLAIGLGRGKGADFFEMGLIVCTMGAGVGIRGAFFGKAAFCLSVEIDNIYNIIDAVELRF